MIALLAALVFLGAVSYYLLARRPIDFYALAFFSCVIYFMPSLFGYVWHTRPVNSRFVDVFIPIDPRVRIAHALILAIVLAATVLHDRLRARSPHGRGEALPVMQPASEAGAANAVFALLAVALYAVFVAQDFDHIVLRQKGQFGRFYALAAIAIPYAFTLAATSRHRILALVFGAGALLDLYVGNREPLVFAILGTAVILLAGLGPVRLIAQYRYIVAAAVCVLFVLAYKNVALQIRLGNWPLVFARLTNPQYYVNTVARSEPFLTQSILHYALVQGWSFDGSLVAGLVSNLVPFGNIVVGDPQTVSGHINDVLFERVTYGVASNLWAEAYIHGRWLLLVVYALVYAALPAALNTALARCRRHQTRAYISVLGVLLLFYIQRIGLDGTVTWVKRLTVVYVVGSVGLVAWNLVRARLRPAR